MLLRAVLVATALLVSCAAAPATLTIDLRTDLVPHREFAAIETQVFDAVASAGAPSQVVRAPALGNQDFVTAQRIAELDGLPSGEMLVLVRLLDGDGVPVVDRRVRVTARQNRVVTVVITRDCRGIVCDPAADGSERACLGGRCVDARCVLETPELCEESAECATDAECPTADACAQVRCLEGTCLAIPRDESCDEGALCDPERGCTTPGVTACTTGPVSTIAAPARALELAPFVSGRVLAAWGSDTGLRTATLDANGGDLRMLGTISGGNVRWLALSPAAEDASRRPRRAIVWSDTAVHYIHAGASGLDRESGIGGGPYATDVAIAPAVGGDVVFHVGSMDGTPGSLFITEVIAGGGIAGEVTAMRASPSSLGAVPATGGPLVAWIDGAVGPTALRIARWTDMFVDTGLAPPLGSPEFAFVAHDDRALLLDGTGSLTAIASDATIAAGPTSIASSAPGPSLASTPYGLVAAYHEPPQIMLAFLDADLSVRGTLALDAATAIGGPVSVTAVPGGPLLVAWSAVDDSVSVSRVCASDIPE